MSELRKFEDIKGNLKHNQPVVFTAPLFVKDGSSLFHEKRTVHALFCGGLLCFIDDDKYFAGGPRALRVSQIREDQQVSV